jgi:hypothetical protein
MPTALLVGYPHHVRAIARFVNRHATRWRLVPEGTDLAARNRALTRLPFVDALVAFGGPAPNALLASWMRRRGKPIAVVWAGSDVVEIRDAPEEIARVRARRFRHVACSAALAQELSDLGIPATELRLVVAEQHAPLTPLPSRFSVLGYCPGSRGELYGVDILLEVMRRLPHVHFDIVGGYCCDTESPNATYHGWVDDIGPSIDAVTVVVRPTRHDGMPLMVLEALARGRHVIWSNALDGVVQARTADEIVAQLEMLYAAHRDGTLQLNEQGFAAIENSFSPTAVTRSVEAFLDDLLSDSESRRQAISASRQRAVASGAPRTVAAFIEQVGRESPRWDVHPLIGRSRSERFDDMLAMMAAERWLRLDDHQIDPAVARVARMMRKEPVSVKFNPEEPLNGALHKRRNVTIVNLTQKEWRAFDACHPAPTYFARPGWAMALESSFEGLSAEPKLFRLSEGEALFPLMRSGRRFVSVEAMPLGTYTMPLSPDGEPADPALAEAIVHRIIERSSADFSCTLWPMGGYGSVNGCERTLHQASVIDLRDGAEAALARFKGVARRMAGQAMRKGVVCAPEPDAVGLYYSLLEESAKRWGKEAPHLPRRLFESLVAFGGNDVEIWIARYKGEAIAGGIMLYGSREAFFWSAAMRAKYADLRPSNLLNVEMIKTAVERGMQWYNLGASEGLDGVARFKESLGAESVDYATLSWKSSLYRNYQKIRSALHHVRTQ